MSQGAAPPADPPKPRPGQYVWDGLRLLLIPFLVIYVVLVIYRLSTPAEWAFSIEAQSQVAEVTFPPGSDSRWRIDEAVLCARKALDINSVEAAAAGVCGSRAWRPHPLPREAVVALNGDSDALLEVRADGSLAISLRAGEGGTLGTLSLGGVMNDLELPDRINLIWMAPGDALMFPFAGATTVGRDVSWSDTRVLTGGKIEVYSGDESANRRRLIATAKLVLGDQVRLGRESGALGEAQLPKGFIRFHAGTTLDIVAFGRAESVAIERFGDSGYNFRPGWFVRLINDALLVFWGSLLGLYMGFIGSIRGMLDRGAQDPYLIMQVMKRLLRRLRGVAP